MYQHGSHYRYVQATSCKKDDAVVNLSSVNINIDVHVYALRLNIGYTYNEVFEPHVILHRLFFKIQ